MLPRGLEVARMLRLRQRLMSRRLCPEHSRSLCADIFHRFHSNTLKSNHHYNQRRLLQNSEIRQYTTKEPKIVAAPIKVEAKRSSSEQPTSKTKATIEKTATESNPINDACPAPISAPAEHEAPPPAVTAQTKTLEVNTSKGVLSITTTIEDSKINDVVFEKTKMKTPTPSIPAATFDDKEESQKQQAEKKKKIVVTIEEKTDKIPAIAAAVATKMTKTTAVTPAVSSPPQSPADAIGALPPKEPQKPKRTAVDFNRSSLERNFVTPLRAMADFLLKASDLESLPKIKRRSPYEQEPPITVFWRKDVEAKAIEVWGSRENLLRELLKREIEYKKHQQNIFTVKRRLRSYRREMGARTIAVDEPGLRGKSGKVVVIAIAINGINFLFKVCGWLYSGSHSMFAESIHSLADTINQCILAYGIHKSVQIADHEHPYGYANMKYVSSLISGVGIFCVGTGLSYYHGITGLLNPEPVQDLYWAFFILGGSFVSEGATLLVAANEVRRSAKLQGISFKEYVLTGKDPCVNVVLMEDAAAVTSVAVAVSCMGLSTLTGLSAFDAIGSMLVGTILGGVASFIIYTNAAALVGKSIPDEQLDNINSELESDLMIRAIHDVKGIDMGNSLVRYKAEMDFDGRELTRCYLDRQDLNELFKVVKSFKTAEELELFLLTHGENIVDLMGGEIDRIEMKLRKKFPQIRHCDLEIL